jgi:hypothetical protein
MLLLNEKAAAFDTPSVRIRQRENSFAAPYTNDVQLLGPPSIYDPEL